MTEQTVPPRQPDVTPAAEPRPAAKELLDVENYGAVYGRLLFATQLSVEDGLKILNPETTVTAMPRIDNPTAERNYNPFVEPLSTDERRKAWDDRDLNEAYAEWMPKFKAAITNPDKTDRIAVIKALINKDAADIKDEDVNEIYNKYCKKGSDITAYVNDIITGFTENGTINQEEIEGKIAEIQWVASKLFGTKSSEITVIIANLEVLVKTKQEKTITKFYTTSGLNDWKEPGKKLLTIFKPEAPAATTPAAPEPVSEPAPEEFLKLPKADRIRIYREKIDQINNNIIPISPTTGTPLFSNALEMNWRGPLIVKSIERRIELIEAEPDITPEDTSTLEFDGKKITIKAGLAYELNKLEDSFLVDLNGRTIAVFDGMGGPGFGAEASQIARVSIADALRLLPPNPTTEEIEQALKLGYKNAKQEITKRETDDHNKKGFGTTASIAILHESEGQLKLTILQMGDSRIYIVDDDSQIRQISDDWSLVNSDLAQGKITREEAAKINTELDTVTDDSTLDLKTLDYFDNRHRITGALAARGLDEPTILTKAINPDFRYILTTSDGVHDNLTVDEIASAFKDNPDPQEAAKKLVELAKKRAEDPSFRNSRSKDDDITAVVLSSSLSISPLSDIPVAPPATPELHTEDDIPAAPLAEGEPEKSADDTPPAPPAAPEPAPSATENDFIPLAFANEEELKTQLLGIIEAHPTEQFVAAGMSYKDITYFLERLMGEKLLEKGTPEWDRGDVIIRSVKTKGGGGIFSQDTTSKVVVSNSKDGEGKLTTRVVEGDPGDEIKEILAKLNDFMVEYINGIIAEKLKNKAVRRLDIRGRDRDAKIIIGIVPTDSMSTTNKEAPPAQTFVTTSEAATEPKTDKEDTSERQSDTI